MSSWRASVLYVLGVVLIVLTSVVIDQQIEARRLCESQQRERQQLTDLIQYATTPEPVDPTRVPDVEQRTLIMLNNQRSADFRAYAVGKLPPISC